MQTEKPPNASLPPGWIADLTVRIQEGAHRPHGAKPALAFSGLMAGAKACTLAALFPGLERTMVVVCPSLRRAEMLAEDLVFFGCPGPVAVFPHWDTVPYDAFSPHTEVIAQRFTALEALVSGKPALIVTTPQALLQGMIPLEEFKRLIFELRVDGEYPRADLVRRLEEAGYLRVDMVEAPGEYGLRGEIVDIFPLRGENPVRLDFFDDLLESIRIFDVTNQTSFDTLEAVTIHPAGEGVVNKATAARALKTLPHHKGQMQPEPYRQLVTYLQQERSFPGFEHMMGLFYEQCAWLEDALPEQTLIWIDEPQNVEHNAEQFHGEVLGEFELNLRQGNLALPPETFYRTPAQWRKKWAGFQWVTSQALRLEDASAADGGGSLVLPFADNSGLRSAATAGGKGAHASLENMLGVLKGWRDGGAPVYLAARSETAAERLRGVLAEFEIGAVLATPAPDMFLPLHPPQNGGGEAPGESAPEFTVLVSTPHQGMRVVDDAGATRFALVTEEELLGERTRQRRLGKSKLQHFIASLGELKEGELVVHVEYGIGRYDGLQRLQVGGEEEEFLVLAYAGEDKVYVPVYKFNQVQKFTGVDEGGPALNRLGDGAWQRAKAKAGRAIEDMAEDLVAVHAQRKARKGHAYQPNTALMTEFEEAFAFQETEDQQTAIEEVLEDLSAEEPMDRLVCGDVGFGKTEVAMRAAYLIALEGRQVMMLVPTTILAQQHYETFRARFEPFPVRIEVLSRFRSAAEQKEVVRDFTEGKVDILIGTHRLLSKDIRPKALGLLVIDEEQRFGVAHKEKIKAFKTQVEVLTLSATPIPRTLHMSLMGVRDLSIINTPPMDRMAVRTRLVKAGDYIITEAIEREVRRGGQVFIVQNRVERIHHFATYVQSLVPHLRVAVAHGQMPEKQLEEVMLAFVQGEVEVLVSTSIIESGLDIPRANTILINNADHFGLAQLYQLRGRVGRSNVQAYAYVLVSPDKVLTDVAQKRLTLLQELNDLGSGFKIASHDMEIRGVGNLLGREQSGHVNTIGLELFTHMVEEAVARLKGEEVLASPDIECKLELGFPYLLPETYISGTKQRLEVYKTLADVPSEEALWETRQALEDRYGKIPEALANLFILIRIRLLAVRYGLSAVEKAGGRLLVRIGRPERINLERLMTQVANPESPLQLLPDERLVLGAMPGGPEEVLKLLELLDELVIREMAA